MSLLDADNNEQRSYLEIADALRRYGARPEEDCALLWRRIVLSILISNTDDHLRNHGFLYDAAGGWRLSPAYDLNPVPVDIKPRILTTAIDEGRRDGVAGSCTRGGGTFRHQAPTSAHHRCARLALPWRTLADVATSLSAIKRRNRTHVVRVRA